MKKICFVTAARSEYGLLKWLMEDVEKSDNLQLQLIVTGGHLLPEQGHTIDQIIADGFQISATVDSELDSGSAGSIAVSMGNLAKEIVPALEELAPDYLIVLGDRYELLPICSSAFMMRIPIIHISGGDVTIGALDDGIRNAVTMLAEYHFPGTQDSADNIIRMRGCARNIWAVGEPGLDALLREPLMTRDEIVENLHLDSNKLWVILTYHAETTENLTYNLDSVRACVDALNHFPEIQVVATYSNADYGGQQINQYLETAAIQNPEQFKIIPSLGSIRYLSLMKYAKFLIGNSSSGIIEAPVLHCTVINIGNRQKGRHMCSNIIQCSTAYEDIYRSIEMALHSEVDCSDLNYWGDGHTSEKIMKILEEEIIGKQ